MKPPIVLLTDFGTKDPFVGIMKGVIQKINPDCPLIDLTHEINPGDIFRTSITLWLSYKYFPKGSTFLTVVDPGVGTPRLPIIMKTDHYTFVGPDNGVFSFVASNNHEAWILSNPKYTLPNPRMTFHGRDIFAPCAAHAASGIPGSSFGDLVKNLVTLEYPQLRVINQHTISGEVLYDDRFGNLLTSLGIFTPAKHSIYQFDPWTTESPSVDISLENSHLLFPDGDTLIWYPTFGAIPEEHCAVILGSSGLLEIVANRQSAAKLLNLKRGDPVTLVATRNRK